VKYCEKCNVNVIVDKKTCPLCQGFLSGESDGTYSVFPHITSVYVKFSFFFKILLLASIIIASISISLNILFPQRGAWSLFVLGGLVSIWVSLITAINKRNNIPKNIAYQVVTISLISVVWDLLTKWKGWSIDYVIPFICFTSMISMAAISTVMKKNFQDNILYLIINGLFGIVPLVFLLTGMLNVIYPTLICIVTSIISFSTLLIFEGESLKSEIKKRLHV
jgi:hypothetical protein